MSNIASEEEAVLVGIFARCCLNGFYQKSIQTKIQISFCFFKHKDT